jgi:thiol-disulfide isomerase/thioredoxin
LLLAVAGFLLLRPGDLRVVPPDRAPQASPLTLRGADGTTFDLASLRGRVVLVNLWAGWCGPCRREIPRLARIQRRFAERGLVVVGVNVEDIGPGEVALAARRLGISYRTAQPAAALAGTFAGEGVLPQTWLIDREGRVRGAHAGLASEASLAAACAELLDQAAGS